MSTKAQAAHAAKLKRYNKRLAKLPSVKTLKNEIFGKKKAAKKKASKKKAGKKKASKKKAGKKKKTPNVPVNMKRGTAYARKIGGRFYYLPEKGAKKLRKLKGGKPAINKARKRLGIARRC